jgi:hypothetical protein
MSIISVFEYSNDSAARESRVRRVARRKGYTLRKSRARNVFQDRGGYQLLDRDRWCIVLGPQFETSLEQVEAWLSTADEALMHEQIASLWWNGDDDAQQQEPTR